jgi:hypothetical protein
MGRPGAIDMIYWAKRVFDPAGSYGKVQDMVAELQMKMGGPHELMMFAGPSPDARVSHVYIGMPTRELLRIFEGFTEIAESELPDGLTRLVTRDDEFEERFPHIAAKRHRFTH